MRVLIVCCAMGLGLTRTVSGCQIPDQYAAKIDSVVERAALDTLLQLVTHGANYRAMGFDSIGDVRTATLDTPYVIFYVPAKELSKFKPGADPSVLLKGGDRVLYPVLVRGMVRSSIILARQDNGWRGEAYGGASAPKLAVAADSAARRGYGGRRPRYFWVDVVPQGLGFLAFTTSGHLMLLPLQNDPLNRWKAGVPVRAESVFGPLADEVRAYERRK